jgi:hypothetical protein
MKIRQTVIPLFALLAVGIMALTAVIPQRLSAEPLACNSSGFVITGADANWCESTTAVPNPLSSLLNQVLPRVAADYARAILRLPLTAVPAPLNNNLALVADRVGLDYARANLRVPLAFPVDVVNDTAVPQLLGDITISPSGETATRLTWITNEVANSRVQFGTQPGNYTGEVFDDLYVTQHSLVLTGLQEGVTYYYKLSSADPSGNTLSSQEFTFTFVAETKVFLPVIIR